MNKFEKVSYEQFAKDSEKLGYTPSKEIYESIELPVRSTTGSAGYDFVTPYPIDLGVKQSQIIPTGIRVLMDDNKVLMLYPRSGLGFKTGMHLANTTGVIDASYSQSDNEGHIMAEVVYGFDKCEVDAGGRFMQGVITKYFITDDDNVTTERNGGIGSTGV